MTFGLDGRTCFDELGDVLGDGSKPAQFEQGLGIGPDQQRDEADQGHGWDSDEKEEPRADRESAQKRTSARLACRLVHR